MRGLLPRAERFLRPGVTFETLDQLAAAASDLDAARNRPAHPRRPASPRRPIVPSPPFPFSRPASRTASAWAGHGDAGRIETARAPAAGYARAVTLRATSHPKQRGANRAPRQAEWVGGSTLSSGWEGEVFR